MTKIAAVTGASSGIGAAAAKLLAERGYKVYGLCRGKGVPEGVCHVPADVTDEASIRSAFEAIAAQEGKLDLLVSNAGFGISGAVELTALEDAKRQLDVNFFGGFLCAKYAVPLLRKAGGRIIFVSSAAAIFSIPFQAFYSASKSALNSLTLALRNELRPFGICVCALMPGDVKTGFTAARDKCGDSAGLYCGRIERSVGTMEKDEINGMSPAFIAGRIVRLAGKKRPKPITAAGAQYRIFAVVAKLLPTSFVNFIVGKMYIKN